MWSPCITTGGVSVADCGAGVAAERRERIFERFWRGKGDRRKVPVRP
jgi:signal transduction histidine kinase